MPLNFSHRIRVFLLTFEHEIAIMRAESLRIRRGQEREDNRRRYGGLNNEKESVLSGKKDAAICADHAAVCRRGCISAIYHIDQRFRPESVCDKHGCNRQSDRHYPDGAEHCSVCSTAAAWNSGGSSEVDKDDTDAYASCDVCRLCISWKCTGTRRETYGAVFCITGIYCGGTCYLQCAVAGNVRCCGFTAAAKRCLCLSESVHVCDWHSCTGDLRDSDGKMPHGRWKTSGTPKLFLSVCCLCFVAGRCNQKNSGGTAGGGQSSGRSACAAKSRPCCRRPP